MMERGERAGVRTRPVPALSAGGRGRDCGTPPTRRPLRLGPGEGGPRGPGGPEAPRGEDAPGGAERRGRLLVVDDDASVARSIARLFQRTHDVRVCASADAARGLLAVDDDFDLVLCDLSLAGDSGIALYGWIAAHLPALEGRVAFVTGGATTPEARAFLSATSRPVLHKPLALPALRAIVHASAKGVG